MLDLKANTSSIVPIDDLLFWMGHPMHKILSRCIGSNWQANPIQDIEWYFDPILLNIDTGIG
jgi:hypothetical protein